MTDFDALDHGDGPVIDPLSDEDAPYFVLFADALDPATDVTIEGRRAEWEELFA